MVSAISSRGPSRQRTLGEEHVVVDAERVEIVLDHGEHGLKRSGPRDRQPFALRHGEKLLAMLSGELLADRLEIVAGIKPFGNFADLLAQRFAIAQIGRAGERIDLGAGVVDIVFARHGKAGEGKKIGERIAEHGAAAMADMHGAGRVGRHILDVHGFAFADGALAIGGALLQHHAQHTRPECRGECQIDEARPRDLDFVDMRVGGKQRRDALGERAGAKARLLGQHHGGIGGEIAVRGILRRPERDALDARFGRHDAVMLQLLDGGEDPAVEPCKNVHGSSGGLRGATNANRGWRQTGGDAPRAQSDRSFRR